METFGFRMLTLVLLAAVVRGADHDVMQVKLPFVVKHPLGPSMEVHRQQQPTGQSSSSREMRNANYPGYNGECFSCTTGTLESSNYGSSSGYSAGRSYGTGSVAGSGTYGTPLSTSSRQEFRSEQKFVNGQPVYDLHHERRFQDGRLVHEEKSEKDEDDFGVSKGSGISSGNHASGSNYDLQTSPGYSKQWEKSRQENYSFGSSGLGSGYGSSRHGSDEFSSNFNAEVARLREQLHRQMGTSSSHTSFPATGNSHRSEVHSETRYINGQPVYVKKEEKKYKDGKLIHDHTEEKGATELGTEDLERQYDLSGGLITGGSTSGYHGHRQEYYGENVKGVNLQYPASYGNNKGSGWESTYVQSGSHRPVYSSSSHSLTSSHSANSGYRPTYGGSTRYNQEHYSSTGSQPTGDFESSSSEPEQSSTHYSQNSRVASSSYPSYRPYSETSSTQSRQESYDGSLSSSSSHRPTHQSSTDQYNQESRDSSLPYRPASSTNQYNQETRDTASTYSSHRPAPHTPTHGSSSHHSYRPVSGTSTYPTHSQENSSSYPDSQPSSGSSSIQTSKGVYRTSSHPSYRPSSGSSSTRVSEETSRTSSYRPSSGSYSSSYPSHRPSEDSQSSRRISEETSRTSSYRPSSGSSSSSYPSYRPSEDSQSSGSSSSSYPSYRPSEDSQSSGSYSSSYPSYRPSEDSQTSGSSSSSYPSYRPPEDSQTSGSSSSSYPSYRPSEDRQSSGSYSSSYPSYRPSEDSQSSGSYSSSYPSYRPSEDSQSSGSYSSSYPSYRPSEGSLSSGSSSRRISEETSRTSSYRPSSGSYSSSYPSYRPSEDSQSSGSSSRRISEETRRTSSYRPSSGSFSSSYPSYRPSQERQPTAHSEERHALSSFSSESGHTDDQYAASSENLEETRILQNARDSSLDSDTSYTTHINMNAINQEPSRNNDQYYNPAQPESSNSPGSSHSITSETRYRGHDYGNGGYSSPAPKRNGGVRTVAVDLSSSSSSDSLLTNQLLHSSQGTERPSINTDHSSDHEQERRSYHSRTQHSSTAQSSASGERHPVGIPGVISGPQTSHSDGNYENKERYDISPLDDVLPKLPVVGNEIDSSMIPTLPSVEGEIDSSDFYGSHTDESSNLPRARPDGSSMIGHNREDDSVGGQQLGTISGHSYSSHLYNDTHTVYGTPIGQPASTVDRSHYDYSRSSITDEPQRYNPASSGSSHYRYNETRRHSTVIGGQQNPHPVVTSGSSSLTSDCTQISGCGLGLPQSSSRRSEIRTSKRYVNGQLVGITHYERQYENGKLVHENVTEHGINELTPQELHKYGIDQLSLVHGSYQPESYSQRHEVKQEKKYVNGQQIYDLHHERRFEDGQLVHENRTEKDANDLGVSSLDAGQLGVGYSGNQFEGPSRHEVTQSQHLQQHVTSDRRPGSVGQSSGTHQVSDTSRVITKPVYTTRRHETRRQQEYINGQPVYDLQHERRYQDGSLVYENRTELDEKDIGESSGGHYDALHQIMSGNTLNTASESSYNRPSEASGAGSYDSVHGTSYEESSATQTGGSYRGSSTSENGGPYRGSSTLENGGSYRGSSTSESGGSYRGSSASESGGSYGGSSSSLSSVQGSSQTYGSSGSPSSSSLLLGGSLETGGGATTTVLGDTLGLGASRGESSSRQYSSSHGTSRESSGVNSGCLTCVLLGGTGYSSKGSSSSSSSSHAASHGYSGTIGAGVGDGYSQRTEMNREEYYEDGQLVHGQEEDRRFQDGQLVQENRRRYSGIPGQSLNTEALQSAGTTFTSSSSSASSSRSSSSSSTGGESEYEGRVTVKGDTTGVCDPTPCQNGGTCITGFSGPLCVCTFGFKGARCEEVYCPRRFCRHGGTCKVEDGSHECTCKNNYSGPRCQTRTRRHASRP